MQKKTLFRRSADFEGAPGPSPGHIDFPRIDNIRHYLEAAIVNVYKNNGKSITFSRKLTSRARKARVGRDREKLKERESSEASEASSEASEASYEASEASSEA